MSKALLARDALARIPRFLAMEDRNAHSSTHGCFDRAYWHDQRADFANGALSEMVLPLALVFSLPIDGNPYFRQTALRDWVGAGILYAAHTANPDGSCPECHAREKSVLAAAASLLALLEAYSLLNFENSEMRELFATRADWLASCTGGANRAHENAYIAAALERAGRLFDTTRWDVARQRRLSQLLGSQDSEGWFPEDGGFDPSYQTLVLELLARCEESSPTRGLKAALQKGIEFIAQFVHPDGSFGGEYGCADGYLSFPLGFELVGKWLPLALQVNDAILAGRAVGVAGMEADDSLAARQAASDLLAWKNWVVDRPEPRPRPIGREYFRNAGIVIDRTPTAEIYIALNKGGLFKLFKQQKLAWSDTQFSVQAEDGGRLRTAVAHERSDYEVHFSRDYIEVTGALHWVEQERESPAERMLLGTVRRFLPDASTPKPARKAPFTFTRRFEWIDSRLKVIDELRAASWTRALAVGMGAAQSTRLDPASGMYQAGQLQPWVDLTERARALADGEALKLEREF